MNKETRAQKLARFLAEDLGIDEDPPAFDEIEAVEIPEERLQQFEDKLLAMVAEGRVLRPVRQKLRQHAPELIQRSARGLVTFAEYLEQLRDVVEIDNETLAKGLGMDPGRLAKALNSAERNYPGKTYAGMNFVRALREEDLANMLEILDLKFEIFERALQLPTERRIDGRITHNRSQMSFVPIRPPHVLWSAKSLLRERERQDLLAPMHLS